MGKLGSNTKQDKPLSFSFNPISIGAFLFGAGLTYILGIGFLITVLTYSSGILGAMALMVTVSSAFILFIVFLLMIFLMKWIVTFKWFTIGVLFGVILIFATTYLSIATGYLSGLFATIGGII